MPPGEGLTADALPPTLPDLLGPGMRVLFVGFNPSVRAARLGHYYAGRGNRFWDLLAASGLTPRRLHWSEDDRLLDFGIGVTDLAKRPTRAAAEVTAAEYRAGALRLDALVRATRPRVVAYNGKGVYLRATRLVQAEWGLQPVQRVEGVDDFVLPSPSGLARLPFAEKAAWYTALRAHLDALAA